MMPAWLRQHPRAEYLARRLYALYPMSSRLGPAFWAWYAFLKESETWSPEQLRSYQMERIRELLTKVRRTSPYYRQRLEGVDIGALDSPEAFARAVPAMSRLEFAANYAAITGDAARGRRVKAGSTSGTTGNALQFVHPEENVRREWAAICHQWSRVGYDPVRSRRAEFRGLTRHQALYQEFPEHHMARFSILDLHAKNLPAIADVIRDRRLDFFHGYPSAIYLLAREITRTGFRFPAPKAVLLASEMVHGFQLDAIRAAFPESRLFAHYGCAEYTVLGAWCEHRQAYHTLPQYSLVEIDPATGEIIGTNLHNDINAFIRYRMTDTASKVETKPCPACGRPYTPVLDGLDGRREDYLFSREKGWIAPAIVTYPLKHLHAIQEIQFHQDDPGRVVMKHVNRTGASPDAVRAELADIEAGMRGLLGSAIRFIPEEVAEIPRGTTGKYKWIVSSLDPRAGQP